MIYKTIIYGAVPFVTAANVCGIDRLDMKGEGGLTHFFSRWQRGRKTCEYQSTALHNFIDSPWPEARGYKSLICACLDGLATDGENGLIVKQDSVTYQARTD